MKAALALVPIIGKTSGYYQDFVRMLNREGNAHIGFALLGDEVFKVLLHWLDKYSIQGIKPAV